jgi:hypothetical protein
MKALTRHDVDLIETMQAHVRNLASLSTHNADEPTVRIATGALRALLSGEMLQRLECIGPSWSDDLQNLFHHYYYRG